MDIHVHIHCPDLVSAASTLAAAWGKKAPASTATQGRLAPAPTQAAQAPQQVPPTAWQTAPVTPAPQQAPVAPTPQAPTAGPTYTVQDLSIAGANLIRDNPALQPQVMGLLTQFGVQAATELKPDQLGPFANALRSLGAKL